MSNAGILAVDLAVTEVAADTAGAGTNRDGDADAGALLGAVVVAAVLLAGDVDIAAAIGADVHAHLLPRCHRLNNRKIFTHSINSIKEKNILIINSTAGCFFNCEADVFSVPKLLDIHKTISGKYKKQK